MSFLKVNFYAVCCAHIRCSVHARCVCVGGGARSLRAWLCNCVWSSGACSASRCGSTPGRCRAWTASCIDLPLRVFVACTRRVRVRDTNFDSRPILCRVRVCVWRGARAFDHESVAFASIVLQSSACSECCLRRGACVCGCVRRSQTTCATGGLSVLRLLLIRWVTTGVALVLRTVDAQLHVMWQRRRSPSGR